jgi:hypothetical protein
MRLKWLAIPAVLLFVLPSCNKDNGFSISVKGIEGLVYQAIKDYRENNGLTGPFVHQYIMVGEAQIYSARMADGTEPLGTQGLADHWNTIHGKIGGYNDHAVVLATESTDEDEILSELLDQPGTSAILLEDVTQCGVGIEPDGSGTNYVTVLLMKVD